MFRIVQAGTLTMVGSRLIDVTVYSREESQDGLAFFFFSALATVGAFVAAYQWALNIIEVSYKTGMPAFPNSPLRVQFSHFSAYLVPLICNPP